MQNERKRRRLIRGSEQNNLFLRTCGKFVREVIRRRDCEKKRRRTVLNIDRKEKTKKETERE
jgi:hypothetical protein